VDIDSFFTLIIEVKNEIRNLVKFFSSSENRDREEKTTRTRIDLQAFTAI